MVEKKDEELGNGEPSAETENFIEIEGKEGKFKEDPENLGEALKDEHGEPVPFEEPGEEEKITPEKTHKLALALQKGYTLTRQDMAEIRKNQEDIQEVLKELQKKGKEEGGFEPPEGEEPLTVKKYLEIRGKEEEDKTKKDKEIDRRIETQLEELTAQGILTSKKDEEELLAYAVKHKITDLLKAADRWQEMKVVKAEGVKEGAKGKVKEEAGKKIGTSQKAEPGEKGGVPYQEIKEKDMGEIASGE